MDWDEADVRAILQLVDAAGFDELEIETDRFRLSLRRGGVGADWTRESSVLGDVKQAAAADSATPSVDAEAPVLGTEHEGAQGEAALGEAALGEAALGEAALGEAAGRLCAVKTPLPGTLYRSPKPGAPPFVEIGTRVTADTVVAIVETMKLMNSVYAGVSGRIVAIEIADGTFAAQNAVLMQIDPSGAAEGS
jgi:acetyl-CoA carboxylase biotin carboxyl carrier protein